MFNMIEAGKIKALYQVGENPILSEADANHVKKALDNLDFFVVQDIFVAMSTCALPVPQGCVGEIGASIRDRCGNAAVCDRRL